MSEYFFILGDENFQGRGFIPEVFVEKALGYY